MIPYGSFLFFYLIVLFLIPSIILSLLEKPNQKYNIFATLAIVIIIFSNSKMGMLSLVLFVVWQVGLILIYKKLRDNNNRSSVFYFAVILSIVPLILVKIVPIIRPGTLIGFLGISYLTFKAVQMVIEIRDGLIKGKLSIVKIIYFLLFFPTISSGPIDRYRRFEQEMSRQLTKQEYIKNFNEGIHKIFIGFFYKFIVAYGVNEYLLSNKYIVTNDVFLQKVLYMYSYSLYLFFDFAGYSAFAIGISYLLGIKTPENFNKPFISRNIKDFWNRWHMSLSFWFRDYVYMRFVFFMVKKKVLKNRQVISYLGYFLLFLLMGIWHGLELHYILYGLYHALLIVCFDLFERFNAKRKIWPSNKFTTVLSIFITFNAICFGFYIFSGKLI